MVFRHGSQNIHFHPFPSVALSAFRADFNGAFPGLKAWAVLLNRFAVRSNRPATNSYNEYGNWGRSKPAAQILGDCLGAAIDAAWKRI